MPGPAGTSFPGRSRRRASRLTIAAEAAKAAYRGDAPYLLKKAGTDLAEIRSSAHCRRDRKRRQGDP